MFAGRISQTWEVTTEGTYGEFSTPAGRVSYLLTKAKLGRDTSKESTLTRYLAPVREVLDVAEMDFNQLLQRDLDDYRVATDLVDYLLKPKFGGPAFYTPILAALLPFDGANPVNYYPPIDPNTTSFKDSDNIFWQQSQYGNAFRVLRLATDDAGINLNPIKLGRLEFNTALNKLVVIDGQHRAMALLAIRRTIDKDWESKGNRYRFFYEKRVNELLKSSSVDLMGIEFPVCICWFPDLDPQKTPMTNPHQAARKLFVDVNQNAKKPSKSRLILLSDTSLIPIFIRALLNQLRDDGALFPLHVIEYDYPSDRGESFPVRPLALANIVILENALKLALLGPDKYIKNVDSRIASRTSRADEDSRLRRELEVKNWLTQEILEEGISEQITFEREELGNENFPRSQVDQIIHKFMEVWGNIVLKILANFLPFKCHIEAVKTIENTWTVAAAHGELAKDAMFRGLGIYWTLKTDYEQWEENNKIAKERGDRLHDKTETGKAWEAVLEKEREFTQERAKRLFDRKKDLDEETLRSAENTFATLRTQAFISGAILTVASLKQDLGYDSATLNRRVDVWIECWNQALKANSKRVYLFDRKQDDAFLKLPRLESPFSVYFRYLLLELMASLDNPGLEDKEKESVRKLLGKARKLYLEELISQQEKALRRTEPSLSTSARNSQAKERGEKLLRELCKTWFSIKKDDFNQWLDGISVTVASDVIPLEDEISDLGNEEDNEDDALLEE
jgi:DNA-sulfur modification-associated